MLLQEGTAGPSPVQVSLRRRGGRREHGNLIREEGERVLSRIEKFVESHEALRA
jgi:hypothetical protein